jgi:hypothetical protein
VRTGRVQRRTANADGRLASHTADMASHVVGAIRSLPAFGVVFRPFNNWIRSPVALERESNPRLTTYRVVALPTELSSGGHPGVEPGTLRCKPLMTASTDSSGAACAAPTDESGCGTPAGRT